MTWRRARVGIRLVLAVLGVGLFAVFVARVGWGRVLRLLRSLGPSALAMPGPFVAVYIFEALGWRYAFPGRQGHELSYWSLLKCRQAGETLSHVVPTGNLAGEPVKAYLVQRRGVSALAAGASIVISKTVQGMAQVAYLAIGAAAAWPYLGEALSSRLAVVAVPVLSVGAIAVLLVAQRQELFTKLSKLVQRAGIGAQWLARNEEFIGRLDEQVFGYYRCEPRAFARSFAGYLAGWLSGSLEVLLAARLLGVPVSPGQAVFIEAFIGVVKALGFFIPGSAGVQDAGIVLLCHLVDLPESFGVAYALLRRGREAFYVIVGGVFLATENRRRAD